MGTESTLQYPDRHGAGLGYGVESSISNGSHVKTVSVMEGETYISVAEAPPTPPGENGLMQEVAAQCRCGVEALEDVYPCTALQEGMMATTVKDPTAYTVEYEFLLAPGIDSKRLHEAWDKTAQANPILRTRIVPTSNRGVMQAIVKGTIPWQEQSDDDGMTSVNSVAWKAGAPLVYLILHLTKHTLTMMIHHSICDDWSIALLLRQVDEAYRGQELVSRPFRPFVEYVQSTRTKAEEFWQEQFQDAHQASMTSFPHLPTAGYIPRPACQVEKTFKIKPSSRAGFTVNTKLRLAWAMLQSLFTGSDDTLFGTVNAGRGVSVPEVQELSGPAVATVPVRVRLCAKNTVAETLAIVQKQWAAAMEYEQVGLQNLLHLGPGPEAACKFQTLLSVEPRDGHQLPSLFSQHQSTQRNYDLYALVLRCRPSSSALWIEARFDPGVIDIRQIERILSQLAHIYEQIDEESDQPLAELDPVSLEDREEMARWNRTSITQSTPPCVHELIRQRTEQQPQAPAINSWDGDFSYLSLDRVSSAMAVELLRQPVRSGMFVPICLGKSKWTAVAMLALMKVGAAFVLLDPSYPASRMRNMCETLKATVMVTSKAHSPVASQLNVATTLVIDSLKLEEASAVSVPPSSVSPSDPIYATFTSGSTGNPKCVIVHHAGYASSSLAHGKPYHFTPKSRVLQFASPAFDSCIIEHLSTLIMGGCLCIPSAADCSSRLADMMNQFTVNVACLTPTVTRILNPSHMTTLKVLVFVGEPVLSSDVLRWKSHVKVCNAYGPAECSAVFSVQPQLLSEDPANIGFPTGGIGWVVNPEDHNRLMPLGCPGELLIEGMIVGGGYLSNSEQTAKVFMDAPPWRRQFGEVSSHPLYKTGDLVQQIGDGSFRYLGRKDTQVKLHGQRLELADVEHHLCDAFPLAAQAVAEMLRSSADDGRPEALLVAFICLPSSSTSEDERQDQDLLLRPSAEFRAACAVAESRLSDSLPSFMVPAVFLPVSHIPVTPSGKTNRRYLQEHVASLSWEMMQEYRVARAKPQSPSGVREEQLQQIWAQTLNRPTDQIGVNESFFRLGGDSVSAMQVAASCQTAGLNVMVADIFRFPSIRKLALKIQESSSLQSQNKPLEEDDTETWFNPSPIQQLFFENVPDGHNGFTQEFLLRVTKPTSASKIHNAVLELTSRHAMLRARYVQNDDGDWEQIVRKDSLNSFQFREHQISSIDEYTALRNIFSDSQGRLNIEDGPMLMVDLLETETGEQYLGLMAHHLVIDLVSWRVLLQDLEDILTTGRPLQPASMSFQQWCRLQQAYAEESLHPETALPTDIPAAPLRYWGPPAKLTNNTWAETVEKSIKVSREATQLILGAANDAFHTRPVEIIQTAVLYAFVQTFENRPAPAIFSEGHGREPWDPAIDVSRTVGWFTTIAPVFIKAKKDHDFTELLQLTKDVRRATPRNGWAYFASRYLHPEGMNYFAAHSPMEILFNYTGLFQQLERPGALLHLQSVPDQGLIPMPADLPRFALIDVTASVTNGCLNIAFVYNKNLKNQDRLGKWVQSCQNILQEVPDILQKGRRLAVSDFPLLPQITNEQFQGLVHQISHQFDVSVSDIEDIYPCSPIQLGMWLSHAKNPQMYWSHIRWIVHRASSDSPPVDVSRLKEAWQRVVDRHPILRTVFTESNGEYSLQVVFKSSRGNIQVVSQSEKTFNEHDSLPPPSYESMLNQHHLSQSGQPPHQLKLTIQPNGDVFCELGIHHMLVDGVTWQILLSDFHRAYHNHMNGTPAGPYREYIRYLQDHHHQTDSEEYWKQYLDGVNACIFPSLATKNREAEPSTLKLLPFSTRLARHLQYFCQHHGITVSSLLQVAWGIVLGVYTGAESVCFGYLNSCRDIPVPNAREMPGPLINLLICRLCLDRDESVLNKLLETQNGHAQNLEHQHCSLAEVMHSLNLACQPLFNTAMSLQREATEVTPKDYPSEIALEGPLGMDSTEYDLTINIIVGDERISGDLTYWSHLMTDAQAEMVSDTFFHVLSQLVDPANQQLSQVELLGPRTHGRLVELNQQLPQPKQSCIHTDIQKYSQMHAAESALCDADGEMTYGQLEDASSLLARYLVDNGVGREVFVPVCCEKSRWVAVAILAVLKAGGAFILLDPSHPAERLRGMLHQDFSCPVILTTSKHAELAASILANVVEIDTQGSKYSGIVNSIQLPPVSARFAAYAVFTSGSTGRPKASIVEHQSFRSAAEAHSTKLQLYAGSRVLQFASYAFDASIVEILTTLIVGGCVCIPSELDRTRNLGQAISDLRVTWALLTPSVARTLNPLQASSLKTLVLGGEGMSEGDFCRWSPHVHLMNAYGPSECSVIATVQPSPQCLSKDPENIGFPTGGVAWVVSPHTPEKLMPIGAVGELLIEGPIVGRGYMNRPDHMAAFLPYPPWLLDLRGTQRGSLYRTGDLVRLFPDGSLHYMGRKDRQVKLHGQRIELGEIEHQIRQCWPESNTEVFADLIKPADSPNTYVVASVVSTEHTAKASGFEAAAKAAELQLQDRVPSFLIPYAFLPITQIPRLLNGKVDRRQLRDHASRELQAQLNKTDGSPKARQHRQLSPNEQILQQLWAQVLHREVDSIGPDDNFFRLGGDSILVMKLASQAGDQGLKIRVPDVFLHPRLKDLAQIHVSHQQTQPGAPEPPEPSEGETAVSPFSLIPPKQRALALEEAVIQCGVPVEGIEDIYPCTALQAGLAALTAERPGSYIAHHRFRLASTTNLNRLKAAWESVSARIDILRTRLIQTESGCLQVVVRDCNLIWIVDGGGDQKLTWEMVFGQPLIQFEVDTVSDHLELNITLHHAIYDAWSLPLLVHWAELAYDELESPRLCSTSFRTFIQYTMSQKEESLKYWRDHLRDCEADQFPALPFPSYRPRATKKTQLSITTGPLMNELVSRTTAIRLSWALVQSQYQNTENVVFGIVSSGRSAPIRGIEVVAGPTIATIPMSFSVKRDATVSQALADLQERILQLTPYEQVGLSQIAALGPGSMQACSFQTLLIEGRAEAEGQQSGIAQPIKTTSDEKAANAYVLELTIILGKEDVTVEAAFDEAVLPEWQTQRILEHFGHILQRVHAEPHRLLGSISTVSPRDLNELKSWNMEVPALDSRTVISAYQKHSTIRPCAPAVCAWDGKFSYGELDARSNTLASVLQSRGVEPESFVPIYLDRSRWTVVAVLAALKIGAAFVLLDVAHPHMRLSTICDELQPSIIITSINLHAAAQSLVPNTVVVTEATLGGCLGSWTSPSFGPHQALYAVFTSGSTGKPKAAVVENGSFVTMAVPYAKEMGLGADSRMLHFSSYAFDVSILEILGTLFVGGCICILSESERRDHLARAVTELQPSHAILTPSVLRAITPVDVSSVHTIMLIGEPVRTSDIEQWADRVHLLNAYGPAECTVVFTLQGSPKPDRNAANIGFAIAGATWVTDPRDPDRLAPIGAVGELLLEGPLVGRGYLNDAEKTDAAFIPSPCWMQEHFRPAENLKLSARVYRTGDLVRYEEDGSLCFVGRRDCQVKLRGQRFELGEVEAQVQQNFPGDVEDIAAQIITPEGAAKTPCLAVFVALKDNIDHLQPPPSLSITTLDIVIPIGFGEKVKTLKTRLEDVLPEYMIPNVFVPLKHLPRSIGGKIDRRLLRESAARLSRQELNSLIVSKSPEKRRVVTTPAERTLQEIWARALGIAAEKIGVEDSFFRLGGDSISALQATSQARAVGIHHSVGDLFQWRNILQVAKRFSPSSKAQSHLDDPNVEDIIPCTPAQRGILINQMQEERRYAAHFIWHVTGRDGPIDVDRLARAWKAVISQHSALRATFRQDPSGDGLFEQILLREIDPPIVIIHAENDGESSEVDALQVPVALNASSANITWRNDGHFIPHQLTIHVSRSGSVFCRLDINHVILDGKSLAILEVDLCHAYDAPLAERPQPDPYREYIGFVQNEPHEEARKYWGSYLNDLQPVDLPPPSASAPSSSLSEETRERLEVLLAARGSDIESVSRLTDWTPSNLVYFAWALTLSAFSGSDDVCFAISTSGRLIPVAHIDGAVGQFSNMAICRVRLKPELTLNEIAIGMQQDYSQVLAYQSFPLVEISRAAEVPVEAMASTAVIVHYPLPADMVAPLETYSLQLAQRRVLDPGIHDIALYTVFENDGLIRAALTYQPSRVASSLATQLGEYFDLAVSKILQQPNGSLGDLALLTQHDQERLSCWNGALPVPSPLGIHGFIQRNASKQPSHPAVSSWDGDFTYSELDQLASQLAARLKKQGLGISQVVPLCFEKCRWTIVAMIAVMKAGGTFVPLDPIQPIGRLQEICRHLNPTLIITSKAQAKLSQVLAKEIVEVGEDLILDAFESGSSRSHVNWPVDPEQAAYILFTSGSTGKPKGAMVSHSAYTVSAERQIQAFSLDSSSRVLQASSYAFDVSIAEILTTLIAGATVCVPSDVEEHQMILAGVCPISVSHAFLTPTLASGLDATRASSWLQTLILAGEPPSSSHISRWGRVCRLINSYGPTECSVYSTASSVLLPGDDCRNVGRPLGVHAWVVDQHDHNRLLPIGAIGELVLAGPSVGLGYLDQPEKTAEAFLSRQPPAWASTMYPEPDLPRLRLYKTGDLVRYELSDGSLRFQGRKDRQVKVRGQRVELEDVETHVRRSFHGANEIVVEQVMIPEQSYSDSLNASLTTANPRLVVFIWAENEDNATAKRGILSAPTEEFSSTAAKALRQLRDNLPSYMVPDFFISMADLPRTVSGKMDRDELCKALREIPPSELRAYIAAQRNKKPFPSETAVKLHTILIGMLGIDPKTVGPDDSFFHLGGDSILAMKVAATARAEGMEISSRDILRYPTIAQWAAIVDAHQANVSFSQQYAPYSAVTEHERAAIVSAPALKAHSIRADNVVDIMPAVGFQSYYITHSSPVSTAQVFPVGVDIDQLRVACKRLMSHYSILRTVFVGIGDRMFQIILRDIEPVFNVVECEDPETYITQESQRQIPPETPQGSIPVSFTVVTRRSGLDCVFILRISHAQYDGASLPLLWQALAAAYEGATLPKAVQFSEVVYNRLNDTNDEAFAFWAKYLQDAPATTLQSLRILQSPRAELNNQTAVTSVRREIAQSCFVSEITSSTLVKAGLVWKLSRCGLQRDVIFGQVVHGRGCPIPDVDKALGPCINLLPLRVTIDSEWTIMDLLRHTQAQQLDTLSYDYLSFEDIVRKCTNWPSHSKLECIVHHQEVDDVAVSFEMGGIRASSSSSWANSKLEQGQIGIVSMRRGTGLDLMITATGDTLEQSRAELFADELVEVIQSFSKSPESRLSDLS